VRSKSAYFNEKAPTFRLFSQVCLYEIIVIRGSITYADRS
jgi:hypothetical protein